MTSDGRFTKGRSGNPGGQTTETIAKQKAVKAAALEHCPRAIAELVALLSSNDGKLVLAAANSLLDRGLGKPAQALIGGDDGDAPIRTITRIELVDLDGPGSGSPTPEA